ncbi:O-palmitoleoyl transferase [Schistosoma bovis]|uniref:Protein-serine O-palmitoleoyltransferase porcupine n=1 Tax=Schistosoma bovis TaxID=6184 RepID=A0A430QNL4_SCHBO|nr:O-palmitoleoyl transferase [Schistosoma bovis]
MDEQEETWYMDDYEEELLEEIDEEDGDNDLSGNYLDNLETIEGDDDYEDVSFENALSIKSISSEILSCTTPVLKQAYWENLPHICHNNPPYIFHLSCEFNKNPVKWHQIRGSIMIIIMKCISFSMENKNFYKMINKEPCCILLWTPLYRGLLWLSYCLCPASLLFGPWFNPLRYEEMIRNYAVNDRPFSLKNVSYKQLNIKMKLFIKIISISSFFPLSWLHAYFASQSFRFSHYFVCISSESSMTALGYYDKYSIKSNKQENTEEKDNSKVVYKPIVVTRPLFIELPRSLVEVVIYWNLPMHTWLKQYVYKPLRPYGHVYAILGTYTASSLLHYTHYLKLLFVTTFELSIPMFLIVFREKLAKILDACIASRPCPESCCHSNKVNANFIIYLSTLRGLNFQLSAVLFSIGIYAYIEYVFREKLAKILDACIASRPCPESCCHSNKNSFWVYWCNIAFSCLAIFHLAYLAVMFDTSEQQFKGYNMWHTMDKWYNLGFLSHIVAFANFLFYLYL